MLQPPSDEAQHLLRRHVGPVCVVDDRDDCVFVGRDREQRQGRCSDGERRRAELWAEIEHASQEPGLTGLELVETVSKRPEQTLERREGDGALSLDTRGAHDPPGWIGHADGGQQGRLADPGLAHDDNGRATAGRGGAAGVDERGELAVAADEHQRMIAVQPKIAREAVSRPRARPPVLRDCCSTSMRTCWCRAQRTGGSVVVVGRTQE